VRLRKAWVVPYGNVAQFTVSPSGKWPSLIKGRKKHE
jgi:hypothetical protein